MKNLSFALQILHHLSGNVEFDIFGPLEDAAYWAKCKRLIASLPPNVTVRYRGSIDHQQVEPVINQYHLFLLPTLGENFGHAILESFLAACPVLISDRTPWRNLQKKQVGWDLPVDRPDLFEAALRECLNMDEHTWNTWSGNAQQFGTARAQSVQVLQQNRALFWSAVGDPMQHSAGQRA
jgi:glycosyltransferase involved in cell wall biosynthesis